MDLFSVVGYKKVNHFYRRKIHVRVASLIVI